ncbi:patatin-like phospholipase family protein [Kitasatospora sp. LaBMicrA B282]|uniref:patatin-like phospholipase family protein n=1 Tax=Kitasatospora sp. LaBMicrA B282 TaxID=3420949 RepID=UPI003D0B617A
MHTTSHREKLSDPSKRTAFVLGGGGGRFGGGEVGMLRALFEAEVRPDLIVGASVGAVHGAVLAADPTLGACVSLGQLWVDFAREQARHPRRPGRPGAGGELRELLLRQFGAETRIEDLAVPFECVAGSFEPSTTRYFGSGPLVPALLACCAAPGWWPPVTTGGEHRTDDGPPVQRAVELGADTVYLLHVGQAEPPRPAPTTPWEAASVAFELARYKSLAAAVAQLPDGVTVHLLPTGEAADGVPDGGAEPLRQRIAAAHLAGRAHLAALDRGAGPGRVVPTATDRTKP